MSLSHASRAVPAQPVRVLELRSVWGTGGGPEKTILLGAAQSDPARCHVTLCYIRDARDTVFDIDKRSAALGLSYVEVIERNSYDRAIWPALRQVVRDHRIDIVHAHEYKTNLLALALAKFEGVVPLSTAHGWTGHNRRDQVYYFFDKLLLKRFPRVIAVSSDIRNVVVRAGSRPERVTTVLNGIDHRAFYRDPSRVAEARARFGVKPGEFVIGAVGRTEPQKRFDLLIEAFERLRPHRPDLRLLIAGDGTSRTELEAIAARVGPSVTMLGHVADVAAVHHAFDLFVQSSKYEGTPNAVLEAMAFESPLVATDVGGTAELVTDGVHGLIVPPLDVDALTDAMSRALADPAAARTRATAARRRVEGELSFETRMRTVEAIYESLAAERRGRAGSSRPAGAAREPVGKA